MQASFLIPRPSDDASGILTLLCFLGSSSWALSEVGTKMTSPHAEGKEGGRPLSLGEKEDPFQQFPLGTLGLLLVLFEIAGLWEKWQMAFLV